MSDPICEILIGLPACGKTTYVYKMYKDKHTFIYSTDDILEKIALEQNKSYDDVWADNFKNAQKQANEDLEKAINNKMDIVWDQTNLTKKKRSYIIERMQKSGYQIRGVHFIKPEENSEHYVEWRTRLDNRPGKTIPNHILNSMYETYQEPQIEEGFEVLQGQDMNGLVYIDYGTEGDKPSAPHL